MENGAFAPKEQMLHFPLCIIFQRRQKVLLWSKGFSCKHVFSTRVENSMDSDQMALSEAS